MLQNWFFWQIYVVWIKQHYIWKVIELSIGHHLIHVRLAHALFCIVDALRYAFPLCMENTPKRGSNPRKLKFE